MTALLAVILATATLVATDLVGPSSASAATGDLGTRGASVAGFANAIPTAAKPQSKLWFAAGWWWASMASATTGGYRIHHLEREGVGARLAHGEAGHRRDPDGDRARDPR